jgi:phosphoglycerate dehydrogenase-like enzyme
MTALLLTRRVVEQLGDRMDTIAARHGATLAVTLLPDDPAERMTVDQLGGLDAAFFSADIFPERSRAFFAAVQTAPNLKWVHTFNAGTDNPVFGRIRDAGARLTTSSGSTAAPIAQTAIAGLLMLARGFPGWLESQRRREWQPQSTIPADIAGQSMVVVGLGAIGMEIARLGQALGLHVTGVRRTPASGDEAVDALIHPDRIDDVLPQAHWLALAAPLTAQTHRIIDRRRLALLRPGACILNVGRGALVDEAAMIERLQAGTLGGAYLDVFEEEPLPAESPLWTFPNVIVTPHNSSISTGNEARTWEIFLHNLDCWLGGLPLRNEVAG